MPNPERGEELNRLSNAEKIILFSHYPQHSCSTSGSSLCDAYRALKKHPELKEKISVIDQWWDRQDYTLLWAKLIESKFKTFKESHDLKDEDILILYSAHSLPEAYCLEKETDIILKLRVLFET